MSYLPVDGMQFWPISTPVDRNVDTAGGVGHYHGGVMIAPLELPPGSVIQQVTLSCRANAGLVVTLNLLEKVFEAGAMEPPALVGHLCGVVGADGVVVTVTADLGAPITTQPGRTYLLSIFLSPGDSIRGVMIGYVSPTLAFVPHDNAMLPRVFDSRARGGKIGFEDEIEIDLEYPGVRAALFNLTVTDTENSGFVAAFAADVPYPLHSSINYTGSGQTVANAVVCAVSPSNRIKLRGGGPTGRANVIVDRIGWFV